LPENATDQSSFFRRLLEINETLAMAKILVQDKVVAVGTELDYKGATPEQLEVAVRVVVSAAADVTQQLSQNADPLVQAP